MTEHISIAQYKRETAQKPKRSKYGSRRTVIDGHKFHSKGEAKRYSELSILVSKGEVSVLKLQPEYPININGQHICTVKLDFQYFDVLKNEVIHEDYKGFDNKESKLKRKLVEAQYNIKVTLTGAAAK